MIRWNEKMSRRAGLVAGLSLAVAVVTSGRVAGGQGYLGAGVRVLAGPTGELGVTPPGPFVSAGNLEPGAVAEGQLVVHNQTGSRLSVRLRAVPSVGDLDDLLVVAVQAGDHRLPPATLGELRSWTDQPFLLASGEGKALHVRTWLRQASAGNYRGRAVDVDLQFRTDPVESGTAGAAGAHPAPEAGRTR